jgi:membrane protein DedA with SNARE-associated domain
MRVLRNRRKDKQMKKVITMLLAASLAACAGMSRREQNTYIGAIIGSLLWVPGAAIGGYVGHNMK